MHGPFFGHGLTKSGLLYDKKLKFMKIVFPGKYSPEQEDKYIAAYIFHGRCLRSFN